MCPVSRVHCVWCDDSGALLSWSSSQNPYILITNKPSGKFHGTGILHHTCPSTWNRQGHGKQARCEKHWQRSAGRRDACMQYGILNGGPGRGTDVRERLGSPKQGRGVGYDSISVSVHQLLRRHLVTWVVHTRETGKANQELFVVSLQIFIPLTLLCNKTFFLKCKKVKPDGNSVLQDKFPLSILL